MLRANALAFGLHWIFGSHLSSSIRSYIVYKYDKDHTNMMTKFLGLEERKNAQPSNLYSNLFKISGPPLHGTSPTTA